FSLVVAVVWWAIDFFFDGLVLFVLAVSGFLWSRWREKSLKGDSQPANRTLDESTMLSDEENSELVDRMMRSADVERERKAKKKRGQRTDNFDPKQDARYPIYLAKIESHWEEHFPRAYRALKREGSL